jgi:hypothetical protein
MDCASRLGIKSLLPVSGRRISSELCPAAVTAPPSALRAVLSLKIASCCELFRQLRRLTGCRLIRSHDETCYLQITEAVALLKLLSAVDGIRELIQQGREQDDRCAQVTADLDVVHRLGEELVSGALDI